MNQLGSNFDVPSTQSAVKPSSKKEADGLWFRNNSLLAPQSGESKEGKTNRRLYDRDQGGKGDKLDDLQKQSVTGPQGQDLGFDLNASQRNQENFSSPLTQQREQFKRYQQQQQTELEMRNGTIVDGVASIHRGRMGDEQPTVSNESQSENVGGMGGGMGF